MMTDDASRNFLAGRVSLNWPNHADKSVFFVADKGGNGGAPGKGPAAPSKRREQVRQAQRYRIIPD